MGKKQINPPLLHLFWSAKGVKRCQSSGVIFLLPPHSYNILPPLADQKSCKNGGSFVLYPLTLAPFYPPWKPNAAQNDVRVLNCIFLKNPPIAAPPLQHITPLGSPLLHGNFSQGVIPKKSSHCSPLQPTLTWQSQSGGNSWNVLSLRPIEAHSYMAISVRGGGVILEMSSHYSPLQPTLTWQFQSGGGGGGNSWNVLPLQPTLTWQFQSGGNSWNVLPLQPIEAHSYMAISVRG